MEYTSPWQLCVGIFCVWSLLGVAEILRILYLLIAWVLDERESNWEE